MQNINFLSYINTSQEYFNIVMFTFALLSFATVINTLLKKTTQKPVFSKTQIIIKSWWAICFTILAGGLLGRIGFLVLFTLLVILALREFSAKYELKKLSYYNFFLSVIFTLLSSYLLFLEKFDLFIGLPIIYLLCTFPLLLVKKDAVEVLPRMFSGYVALLIIAHCVLYLPALVMAGPYFFEDYNQSLLIFFIVFGLTQANDVFQFIFGKSFGKNKVIPHVSPNKTDAGFLGGIIAITLIGSFLLNHFFNFTYVNCILVSLIISVLGIFGDLSFSAGKRYFKVKDFSELIPGHGGVLDRLDSIVFVGPVLFHLIKFMREVNF